MPRALQAVPAANTKLASLGRGSVALPETGQLQSRAWHPVVGKLGLVPFSSQDTFQEDLQTTCASLNNWVVTTRGGGERALEIVGLQGWKSPAKVGGAEPPAQESWDKGEGLKNWKAMTVTSEGSFIVRICLAHLLHQKPEARTLPSTPSDIALGLEIWLRCISELGECPPTPICSRIAPPTTPILQVPGCPGCSGEGPVASHLCTATTFHVLQA